MTDSQTDEHARCALLKGLNDHDPDAVERVLSIHHHNAS